MDHSHHQRLAPAELTEHALMDAPVYDGEDNKIGSISHVHGSGIDVEAVIDVGGFLGMGAKPVALSVDHLDVMRDEQGKIHAVTSWTRDELKDLPEHHH